tara:strand:+ start:325 stop:495 length:171 start_codon:yes stop_codon:yes gene_type:complete
MNSHEIRDSLRKVMDFLEENEQYGDDWGSELTVLTWLISEADEIERNAGKNQRGWK